MSLSEVKQGQQWGQDTAGKGTNKGKEAQAREKKSEGDEEQGKQRTVLVEKQDGY